MWLPSLLPRPGQSQGEINFISEGFLGFLFLIPTGLGQAPFLNLMYLAPALKLVFCFWPQTPGHFLLSRQGDLSKLQIWPRFFLLETFQWLPTAFGVEESNCVWTTRLMICHSSGLPCRSLPQTWHSMSTPGCSEFPKYRIPCCLPFPGFARAVCVECPSSPFPF